jgi:hypothetical protein
MKTEVFEAEQGEHPARLPRRQGHEDHYLPTAINQDIPRAVAESRARGRWPRFRQPTRDAPSVAAAGMCETTRPAMDGMPVLVWRIADLRPTQMTVGFREVAEKGRRWRSSGSLHLRLTQTRATPVVMGPRRAAYVLDRHHTLCAFIAEGVSDVSIAVVDDLSDLGEDTFWRIMVHRAWCHPVTAEGVRQPCRAIPKRLIDLTDDPFRSLASALRRSGSYAKTSGLFSEFQWAAYLRRHISSTKITTDFSGALRAARSLAIQPAARSLPGWAGATASAVDAGTRSGPRIWRAISVRPARPENGRC